MRRFHKTGALHFFESLAEAQVVGVDITPIAPLFPTIFGYSRRDGFAV